MGYAQKNYNELQGINPKYRIAQIGCFLTAFSNMLTERFGVPIDPLGLNAAFRDRGIYIDIDDGIRDDLGFSSVTQFDSRIQVTQSVNKAVSDRSAGWPTGTNSIVRFWYQSKQTGQMITHFALVADPGNKMILDSWDGLVKKNPYGEPTAWAVYSRIDPAPVVPVTPPPPVVQASTPAPQPTPVTEPKVETVTVKVADWRETYEPDVADYTAKEEVVVKDFEKLGSDLLLHKGSLVHGAGTFRKGGVDEYVRTKKSFENGWWYGIPVKSLNRLSPKPPINDEDINTLGKEASELVRNITKRERLLDLVASIQAFFIKFGRIISFRSTNKNKEQTDV